MSIHRTRKSIWLLLALLALRGMVPAGYMVDVTAGGIGLVVCGSGIYAAAAQPSQAQQGEHHHHQHDGGANEPTVSSDHSICPFAMAATGASGSALFVVEAVVATHLGRVFDTQPLAFSSPGPLRAQQSRAPPTLS